MIYTKTIESDVQISKLRETWKMFHTEKQPITRSIWSAYEKQNQFLLADWLRYYYRDTLVFCKRRICLSFKYYLNDLYLSIT